MKKFLEKAADAYYKGNPLISDEEWDRLTEIHEYDKVGHSFGDCPHLYRMYSLNKFYPYDSKPSFVRPVKTDKLDGASVSLLYIRKGKYHVFVKGVTRGNGVKGQDVTKNLVHLAPPTLTFATNRPIQLNCEIVAPSTIKNARNYAAGALMLKEPNEFIKRELTLVVLDLLPYTVYSSYTWAMNVLENQKVVNILHFNSSQFPKDGVVVREDFNLEFERLGYTSKHPRGAYALKENKEGVITTLRDVKWQVGKSGIVTPVALFDPIEIDGALISKATLHNATYIRYLNLEIGCRIEVIRSGDIIPRVLGRIYD